LKRDRAESTVSVGARKELRLDPNLIVEICLIRVVVVTHVFVVPSADPRRDGPLTKSCLAADQICIFSLLLKRIYEPALNTVDGCEVVGYVAKFHSSKGLADDAVA